MQERIDLIFCIIIAKINSKIIINQDSETVLIDNTVSTFKSTFGKNPDYLFLSPARINIIGEHVDYNDGFVLPAAIDKCICFAANRISDSNSCTLIAKDINESFTFDVTKEVQPVSQIWVNYLLGVFYQVQKISKDLGGLEIVFSSNIPMGSGLSSSAALECGFAFLLNELFNLNLSKKEIALIGQKAEHTFVGVNCGIMDQFASVFGKEEKVILLDCNTLEHQYYDAELKGYSLVLFDSCVKHTHLTSGYNDRRKDVEKGKEIIKLHFPEVQNFREVTAYILNELKSEMGEIVHKRCLYVYEEIKRVEAAANAISNNDSESLGKLITASHHGLSKQYEVSCRELDFLVDEVLKLQGVEGARMMGGGFGGCSINLIKEDKVDDIIDSIKSKYQQEYDIEMKVYQVKISDGIRKLTK